MCNCINVEIGSYSNQVELPSPWNSKSICVDKCLEEEIKFLWSKGIITTGCCCGHNKVEPMINVSESSEDKMIGLGYNFTISQFETKSFVPKTNNL